MLHPSAGGDKVGGERREEHPSRRSGCDGKVVGEMHVCSLSVEVQA